MMTGLAATLILGLGGITVYGASRASKHADDPISRRSAELSIALWSVALAIPLVALAYVGWAIDQGFVSFSDAETAANITAMVLLGMAGFYFSHGRTLVDLLRRRKEWR